MRKDEAIGGPGPPHHGLGAARVEPAPRGGVGPPWPT